MTLMLVRDAWMLALDQTGSGSRLSRVMEYAYATGEDLVDYAAAKEAFDAGHLEDPPLLVDNPIERLRDAMVAIRRTLKTTNS